MSQNMLSVLRGMLAELHLIGASSTTGLTSAAATACYYQFHSLVPPGHKSYATAQPLTLESQQGDPAVTTSEAPNGLTVNDSAVQRLKELQAQNPNKTVFLRIEVEGGGCSGYQYKFSLDSQPSSSDKIFEVDGARVVTDTVSFDLLRGSRIDFEDSLMRRAFVIAENPNSEASCGCGSSFTAKLPPVTRKRKA